MGKIFGISDVKIQLFTPMWETMRIPAPKEGKLPRRILEQSSPKHDVLVMQNKARGKSLLGRFFNGVRKGV